MCPTKKLSLPCSWRWSLTISNFGQWDKSGGLLGISKKVFALLTGTTPSPVWSADVMPEAASHLLVMRIKDRVRGPRRRKNIPKISLAFMSFHTIQLIFEILALGETNQFINSLIDCLDMVCQVFCSLKLNAILPDRASKTQIIIPIFKEHFMTPSLTS